MAKRLSYEEFLKSVQGALEKMDEVKMQELLLTQVDVISDLSQKQDKVAINCFWVLHAIFIALISVDCSDVLNKMSDANINKLKNTIKIASERKALDEAFIEGQIASVKADNSAPSSDTGRTKGVKLASLELSKTLAKKTDWSDAVSELNRWANAIDNFKRTVPFNKKWLTLKELSEALGFDKIDKYYTNKSKLAKIHPEIEAWFVLNPTPAEKGLYFDAEHFQEFKQLMDAMRKENYKRKFSKVADQPKGTWTILEFADKIGVGGDDDNKKRTAVFNIKYALKKKFPQVVDYFTSDGQYFYIKYFQDFQNLRNLSRQKRRGTDKKKRTARKQSRAKSQKVVKPSIKAQLDKVLVNAQPTTNATPKVKPVETKSATLLDMIALDKMLTRWIEMLNTAKQECDLSEKNYNDISAQLLSVKTATERVNILNQMQSANDKILAAADQVRAIQEKIDRANALKQDRQEAARALAEKDALIAAFLQEANVDKK